MLWLLCALFVLIDWTYFRAQRRLQWCCKL